MTSIYRTGVSDCIVLKFDENSRVTLHRDGTVECVGYTPGRDASRVLELMASVLKFHVGFGSATAMEPIAEARMLELAERLDAQPWRTLDLNEVDVRTDLRELVNWVLYRDKKVRLSVVEALAAGTKCPCEGTAEDPGPHVPSCPWNDPNYTDGGAF